MWDLVATTITDTFATHESPSLQSTLSLMGENVLTAAPLLAGEALDVGYYRIVFHVGAYHRAAGYPDAGRFLEAVPVDFVVSDATEGYHVPLLITPWSYSTYRGS